MLPLNTKTFCAEYSAIDDSANEVSDKQCQNRIRSFAKKNNISMRSVTHVAQNTRSNLALVRDFVSYIQQLCKMYCIDIKDVCNFDETNVHFAPETKQTYAVKGSKSVPIIKSESSAPQLYLCSTG